MASLRKVFGFTLVELLVVLGVLSAVTVASLPLYEKQVDKTVAKAIAADYARITRASLRYYRTNGAWPASGAVLVAGNYLTAGEQLDSWGVAYALTVVGGDLRISSNLQSNKYVALASPHVIRPTVTGTTLQSTIDPPGEEPSLTSLYALDGSRALTGAMNANNNNINGVSTITSVRSTATTDMRAPRFYDSNNTAYYVDPASTSNLNLLNSVRSTATADMRAPIYYDSNNTGYYVDPASTSNLNVVNTVRTTATGDMRAPTFYDSTDTSYYVQPSNTSRLNYVDANVLRLRNNYSVGGVCTSGQVGTTSTGELLQCVSNSWAAIGGSDVAAHGYINSGGTLLGSSGVSSVSVTGTGRRRVYFSTARSNTTYTVNCNAEFTTWITNCVPLTRSTTYVDLQTFRLTGGGSYQANNYALSFSVFD